MKASIAAAAGRCLLVTHLVCAGTAVQAAVFSVDTTADVADAAPGDGVCASAAGACSLRAAVMEANTTPDFDLVQLPDGLYSLTLPGRGEDAAASGDLDVLANLGISGAAAGTVSVDAAGIDRVFEVASGVSASFAGITISGGAGVDSGGGIANHGQLALEGCRILANGRDGDPVRFGGGIANTGVLVLTLSRVADNRVGAPGMVGAAGAGIYSPAPLTINASRIEANEALGAQSLAGGVLTSALLQMSTSEIAGNRAGAGAGLLQTTGEAFINASTLRANQAGTQGGGARILGGSAEWVNSTIYDNAANGNGGGLQLVSGELLLRNLTIAGNRADADANGSGSGAGLLLAGGSATLMHSVLSGNRRGGLAEDCSGAAGSAGYNLIEANAGCTLAVSDLVQAAGLLAPDETGLTTVLPPERSSAVIDAGDPLGCLGTQDSQLVVDQQGTPRPLDGNGNGERRCDLGAVELAPLDAIFGDGFD